LTFQENVPLAPLTTLQVGGPARYFCAASSPQDVQQAVEFSRSRDLPLFVLGGGSNLLISDAGWPGVVVHIAIPGIETRGSGVFEVGAGEDWDRFVAHAVDQSCAGIECLSGIPGTVGGTPIQNVGAYGQEVARSIVSVHVLDLQTNEFADIPAADCGFQYRASIFNSSAQGRYVVLRVTYQLKPGGDPTVEYADLQRQFGDRSSRPSLAETRDAVREIRRKKGMLLDPADPDSRSAGSFFKNPVITLDHYQKLAEQHQMPHWWAGVNRVKISAAWLVENAGFSKGLRRGTAGISSKHALALINAGGATASEIAALKDEITTSVVERFGVSLQAEPIFVGEFKGEFRATGP
jgi:UDP-N-acetylmuramate dehydrogenase